MSTGSRDAFDAMAVADAWGQAQETKRSRMEPASASARVRSTGRLRPPVWARAPKHAVLVDVAAAHANALLRDGVEFAELGLGVEADKSRGSGSLQRGRYL